LTVKCLPIKKLVVYKIGQGHLSVCSLTLQTTYIVYELHIDWGSGVSGGCLLPCCSLCTACASLCAQRMYTWDLGSCNQTVCLILSWTVNTVYGKL